MKLEVYGSEKNKEPVVRLKLEETCCGEIELHAVDRCGEIVRDGLILSVSSDGRFVRFPNVNDDLGFALDDHGKVIIS